MGAKGRYQAKLRGQVEPTPIHKLRRICDRCKLTLAGKKGHGFPTFNGRSILCGKCRGT